MLLLSVEYRQRLPQRGCQALGRLQGRLPRPVLQAGHLGAGKVTLGC